MIMNSKGNRSTFLPGFEHVSDPPPHPLTTSMDHVTYVCHAGESKRILEWYSHCFGMKRFLVNSQDKLDQDGIEIGDEVGMRMTVGEWITSWLCREEGVHFEQSEDDP